MPSPDTKHLFNKFVGFKNRVGLEMPEIQPRLRRRLRTFVRKYLRENLEPLPPDTDVTVEHWAMSSSLPKYKIDQYVVALDETHGVLLDSDYEVDGFIKDEDYPEIKPPRLIHSRRARFKAKTGPIFHQIERSVLHQLEDHFIKHVPAPKRAAFIALKAKLGALVLGSDYSKFESSLAQEIMDVVEMQLYSYMVKNLPEGKEFMKHVSRIRGLNKIKYKGATAQVVATRMSGDMCTSLGNGFTNMMINLFCLSLMGIEPLDFVVEGDDGIFILDAKSEHIDLQHYVNLGFDLKLIKSNEIGEAGFCSTFFDTAEECTVAEPMERLLRFGWTHSVAMHARPNKLLGLLRAKSLSLAYEFPRAPVLSALARYGLRVTQGVSPKFSGCRFERDYRELEIPESVTPELAALLELGVPLSSRNLVEKLFKISVHKQKEIENYLDGLESLQPLSIEIENPCWKDDYERYVINVPRGRAITQILV